MKRRTFLKNSLATAALGFSGSCASGPTAGEKEHPLAMAQPNPDRRPNIFFVFTDQLRAQALGYAGDPTRSRPTWTGWRPAR